MIETPRGRRGMVTAPHHLAAQAGLAILRDGGNAIEAMVAMAATIAVVYPHMNSIGGDGFWLIRDARGRVRAIEACGPAAATASQIPRFAMNTRRVSMSSKSNERSPSAPLRGSRGSRQ